MPIISRTTLLALVASLALASGARADTSPSPTLVANLGATAWAPAPTSLPKGAQIAVLAGDPAKAGPFVLRVKFQPNSIVAPHRHSSDENLTILSGTLYHETGEKVDRARGTAVSAGGFVSLPGGVPHTVWTTSAETIVQVTGTGPFGVLYVDPKDDPSKSR